MAQKIYLLFCMLGLALLGGCDTNSSSNSASPETPPEPTPIVLEQDTVDLPSPAQPAHTPGSPGVVVDNPALLSQFGSTGGNLNNARYTRYFLSDRAGSQPDAILVLVPGFLGGASSFARLAEQLLHRAREEHSLSMEVWALDRRSNQLEDTAALDLAEEMNDPNVGLNFLFGKELGLELSEPLVKGFNRRVIFYNSSSDTAFMAQWTPLVHSIDIDTVVEKARETAAGGNVYLGGHSAGTGYLARYAATDFNFSGGEPVPGFRKLRGLVLLEGGGASNTDTVADKATLDLIEARFDGGLFGAVKSGAPRCADGLTPCTVATQALDCGALDNRQCVESQPAYSDAGGLVSPTLMAASELAAQDGVLNGDGVLSILQQEQNRVPGNTAVNKVPGLATLKLLLGDAPSSSLNLLGQFLDDDGVVANIASFLATSVGFPGPAVDGIRTWLSGNAIPAQAFVDNGPAPEAVEDRRKWGVEAEPTELAAVILPMFYRGQTNFIDWYYPSSGLSVVNGLGLDTTALSAPPPLGRGRSDIDNRTQGAFIDVPVIAFGGSNGLTATPASWLGFAKTIAPCAAPACDGMTARVVDETNPNTAFPTFGEIPGGFEVYISEGYSHLDILTAEDGEGNKVISPLLAFLLRHLQ